MERCKESFVGGREDLERIAVGVGRLILRVRRRVVC